MKKITAIISFFIFSQTVFGQSFGTTPEQLVKGNSKYTETTTDRNVEFEQRVFASKAKHDAAYFSMGYEEQYYFFNNKLYAFTKEYRSTISEFARIINDYKKKFSFQERVSSDNYWTRYVFTFFDNKEYYNYTFCVPTKNYNWTLNFPEGDGLVLVAGNDKSMLSKFQDYSTEIKDLKEIWDFNRSKDGIRLTKYKGNATSVTIPLKIGNVPVIGFEPLDDNGILYKKNVKNLIISEGITNIDHNSFALCGISDVRFPNTLLSIGGSAFAINKLTSLSIPESVKTIGYYSFERNQLSDLTIPKNVTYIGEWAFSKNKLSTISISNGVAKIGAGAFNSNNVSDIIIPNSVTIIERYAFMDNPLTRIVIGANVILQTAGAEYIDDPDGNFSFPYNFDDFYEGNAKKAGLYVYNNGNWSYLAHN